MPLLRTTEKIFIGYSRPQLEQKDIAERVLGDINATRRHKHIQLYVCEYRQMVNDALPLQAGINRIIEECDLAILLIGPEVGAGLAFEVEYSLRLFKQGRIYALLPYVFEPANTPALDREGLAASTNVKKFYDDARFQYHLIEHAETFPERLRQHIDYWLTEEERIIERQRDFLKHGLLPYFAVHEQSFDDRIQRIHRRDEGNLGATAETEAAYRRYLDAEPGVLIHEDPLEHYLVARHLRSAVLEDRPELASSVEFINPIHQFLATLFRLDDEPIRLQAVRHFERWLHERHKTSERARSFAAFQLGMLQVRTAADQLIATVRNRGELNSVRHYAIYALGMLRQRSMIIPLIDVHADEKDSVLRDALTNTILYMMGVAE